MTTALTFSATFSIQPTDASRTAPVPIEFSLQYSQCSMTTVKYSTAQTGVAVAAGTVTSPKCVVIQVLEGEFNFRWEGGSTAIATNMSMSTSPEPTYPATFVLYNPVPSEKTLYLSTVGAGHARIWLYQ